MTPNMPNIRAWVAALRSGEFQQGVGFLVQAEPEQPRTYCCLGVACVLAVAADPHIKVMEEEGCLLFDGSSASLPPAVTQWLGIDQSNPMLLIPESIRARVFNRTSAPAITCNDEYKLSFSEIADAVERTFLKEEPHGNGNTATE